MAVIVSKKAEGNRNLKHKLFICFLFYQIDTSNTSRMTFTKSVLQSIKPWECQSSSQGSLEAEVQKGAGAECQSEVAWKAAQKIGQEGTLFPPQQARCPEGSKQTSALCWWKKRKKYRSKTCKKALRSACFNCHLCLFQLLNVRHLCVD